MGGMDHDDHRCAWANGQDGAMRAYHDTEWGVPIRDERHLFELLVLEGAQAGLAWSTILRKRDGYRRGVAGVDVAAVAAFTPEDETRLLTDVGIVRNRAKVAAAVGNARATLALYDAGTTLVDHLWAFVDGVAVRNARTSLADIPSETEQSQAMSRDLRARGFRFVGPTICCARMQPSGLVNDHETRCFRYEAVQT